MLRPLAEVIAARPGWQDGQAGHPVVEIAIYPDVVWVAARSLRGRGASTLSNRYERAATAAVGGASSGLVPRIACSVREEMMKIRAVLAATAVTSAAVLATASGAAASAGRAGPGHAAPGAAWRVVKTVRAASQTTTGWPG